MIEEQAIPYICQVFVCTKDRQGIRESCADGDSLSIRSLLKDEVKSRGWKDRVRVSQCGCVGLCTKGPNVIIYPQNIWFSGVTESDLPEIIYRIESLLGFAQK